MFTFTELCVLMACIVIGATVFYFASSPRNLPPGPIGLPFVGCIPYMKPKAHLLLTDWVKQYGPLYSFRMGNKLIVVLGDAKVVKEALVEQADVFTGRIQLKTVPCIGSMGLIHSDGPLWKEQRKFSLRTLRDFGIGRPILEKNIIDELGFVFDEINNFANKPFDPQNLLNNAVSNIICSMVFGTRFSYGDREFLAMIDNLNFAISRAGNNVLASHHYIPLMPLFTNFNTIRRRLKEVFEFSQKHIDELRKNFNPDQEPTNYIDAFLKAQAETQSEYFVDMQLKAAIGDLFAAGTETTATTLRWGLMYMGLHPKIQTRVQQELDAKLGPGNAPTWSDRGRLPYTEAVIMEIQRVSNLTPMALPHRATEDTTLRGYFIPKNSIVLPLLWAVQRDDTMFGPTADQFDPDRFLEADGVTHKKYDGFMPFSAGKRVCLGESLARMELFFLFCGMMARFRFHFDGIQKPDMNNYFSGVTITPKPFEVIAQLRFD